MRRALLLNAGYEPLNFITDQRAVRLVLKGRAEVIVNMEGVRSVWDDFVYKTATQTIEVPATLRLKTRVKCRQRRPRFRKKVLFNRDHWTCQYCGGHVNNKTAEVEHILPSSRGGQSSWMNCVTACRPCNKKKANKTPEEAGMILLRHPTYPNSLHFWDTSRCKAVHEDWEMFVPGM